MAFLVSAPANLVIASLEGISVRFAGIEFTPVISGSQASGHRLGGIKISLSAARGEETARRDIEWELGMNSWYELRQRDGDESAGHPPRMPAVPLFERIKAEVTDDVGSEYTWVGGQTAGGGTEWDAIWTYQPEPVREAHEIYLHFKTDGLTTGTQCRIALRPDES